MGQSVTKLLQELCRYRIRFNFGYIKEYGWYHQFAFGWSVLCILIYRPGDRVYRTVTYSREDLITFSMEFLKEITETNNDIFLESIPYDFEFENITTFEDYLIDLDEQRFIWEGLPKLIKKDRIINDRYSRAARYGRQGSYPSIRRTES